MRSFFVVLVFILFSAKLSQAQYIEVDRVFGGYKYTQNGKQLNLKNLSNAVKGNPEAYKLVNTARTSNGISTFFGAVGGGLIGWQTGKAITGGDFEKEDWIMLGIGVGFISVGVPFAFSANKKANKAVEIYNMAVDEKAVGTKSIPELELFAGSNRLGLIMRF